MNDATALLDKKCRLDILNDIELFPQDMSASVFHLSCYIFNSASCVMHLALAISFI